MDFKQILARPQSAFQIILYLYRLQTEDEQELSSTVESNGRGFNAFDAGILSSFAEQILKGYSLTPKQLATAKLLLPKYHTQLSDEEWRKVILPDISTERRSASASTSAGTLELSEEPGGIGIVFRPNVYPSKQIKSIGFTRWSDGCWHQSKPSVNKRAVKDVVQMFGDTVVISEELSRHLEPATIELPSEIEGNEKLYPYQKETIRFQLTHPRALVSLAPRLGKTVTTIFAVQASKVERVLVIAPLSLLFDWKKKIKLWSGEDAAIVYKKQLVVPSKWTITNYDTARIHKAKFQEESWDAIVVDESLLIKNRHAKRTTTVKEIITASKPKYVWLLSGAPVSRFYDDMWAQLHVLDPKRFSSYWRFVDQYCITESNQYTAYNIIGNKPNIASVIKSDLDDMYFSRTQEDVLTLPPWRIEDLPVRMSKYQDKLYGSMESDFVAELEDGDKVLSPNVLSQMVRLIQIASNPVLVGGKDDGAKWQAIQEMLEFEEHPVILWTNFIETAERLSAVLQQKKYSVGRLTGSTPQAERQTIVEKFQKGQMDVLVAHPAVGKFGLDLWMAKTVIYLERGYNGDDYYQSLNRVRHVDAKQSPRIIHLLSERHGEEGGRTIDHAIGDILQARKETVRSITSSEVLKYFGKETQ